MSATVRGALTVLFALIIVFAEDFDAALARLIQHIEHRRAVGKQREVY